MAGHGERHDGDPTPDAAEGRAARIARLQRIAYGSGTSEAERAEAVRLLGAAPALETEGRPHDAMPGAHPAVDAASVAASARSGEPAAQGLDPQATRMRSAIAAGALALVGGLLIGWQFGGRDASRESVALPEDTPAAEELTYAEYLEALPRVGDAPAAAVFARESISGDALPQSWVREGFFQQRLLLTLPDGTDVFAARRDAEACLVLAFPIAGGQTRCTEGGRFPASGIRVAVDRDAARFDVVWRSDGSVHVTTEPH